MVKPSEIIKSKNTILFALEGAKISKYNSGDSLVKMLFGKLMN